MKDNNTVSGSFMLVNDSGQEQCLWSSTTLFESQLLPLLMVWIRVQQQRLETIVKHNHKEQQGSQEGRE